MAATEQLTQAAWYWLLIWKAQARLLAHNPDGTIAWPKVQMRQK